MFSSAAAFNQPLSFDTSSVTSMYYMFGSASAFNQPLSLDTSRVTSMNRMFAAATAFNQPLSFDTSSVTDMAHMFRSAAAFNQPLSFDTSRVVTMAAFFDARPSPHAPLPPTCAQSRPPYAIARHTSRLYRLPTPSHTRYNSSFWSLTGGGLLVRLQQASHPLRVGGQLRLRLRWL